MRLKLLWNPSFEVEVVGPLDVVNGYIRSVSEYEEYQLELAQDEVRYVFDTSVSSDDFIIQCDLKNFDTELVRSVLVEDRARLIERTGNRNMTYDDYERYRAQVDRFTTYITEFLTIRGSEKD